MAARLMLTFLVLVCLMGLILSQTFQYSRGWTNGKKRGLLPSFSVEDRIEDSENFGICQMEKLKQILEHRNRDEAYLPCEIIDKNNDCIERLRKKIDIEAILDSRFDDIEKLIINGRGGF